MSYLRFNLEEQQWEARLMRSQLVSLRVIDDELYRQTITMLGYFEEQSYDEEDDYGFYVPMRGVVRDVSIVKDGEHYRITVFRVRPVVVNINPTQAASS